MSLTEAAVNYRIEEWRLTVEEAKAHPELQSRGKRRKDGTTSSVLSSGI
jgi:hypothetical protein